MLSYNNDAFWVLFDTKGNERSNASAWTALIGTIGSAFVIPSAIYGALLDIHVYSDADDC